MKRRPVRILLGWLVAAGSVALTPIPPALAVSGIVKDDKGRPLESVRVCHVQDKVEQLCVLTDAGGRFELPNSDRQLRLLGEGFLPKLVPGRGHHVVQLERSPTLFVRLINASSLEPIDEGEVFVLYASAAKKGPFPTNRAGVRVTRVLTPGDVRVFARAEGFEESRPEAVTLEPGKESEVVLKLNPAP